MWTRQTGSSLTFASITLASLASGPVWSFLWCRSSEPWWSTGSSCPIFSSTRASSSTVSYNPAATDAFWWNCEIIIIKKSVVVAKVVIICMFDILIWLPGHLAMKARQLVAVQQQTNKNDPRKIDTLRHFCAAAAWIPSCEAAQLSPICRLRS